MSQIRKSDLTIPAQTNIAELRTIESNLNPACMPFHVSFTKTDLVISIVNAAEKILGK
jgi:hypothetical protein